MIERSRSEVTRVGKMVYRRSVDSQENTITFDACDRDDVRMELVETILGWFENWKGVHVIIEPYMAEYSLIVRVGWPCGQCGYVRVDGAVDPPVFIRWMPCTDDAILDFTPDNFWRMFTIEWGGDDNDSFGGLCPPGPRQLMERRILESDFTLTNRKYSFDELRSICYELPNIVGWSEAGHDRVTNHLRQLRDELLEAQENRLLRKSEVATQLSRLQRLTKWVRRSLNPCKS